MTVREVSRTDAHEPYWLWLNSAAVRRAEHDHRDGGCDLPTVTEQLRHGSARTRCRWVIDDHRIPPACGCHLCTGHDTRRVERRRDRHRARRELHRVTDDD